MPPAEDETAVTLADRYRLVRRIAAGGMGTVHEGVDERLGRRVAVKVLREEYADDPAFVERFGREARAVASLGDPNIAQVFDVGRDHDRHFIVMELVEGEHLGRVLRERGPLPWEQAAEWAAQVCSALAAAHAAGIVHRDIKPSNVMVRPDGRVKVTDFGIAQVSGQATLTGTGSVLGTPQYLSPEQASGEAATPASDLYSLGVLLFEMLTGRTPFTGDSPVAVALSHIRDQVPSVRDLAPDVPASLDAVVARATAKDPRARYADAGQMEDALRSSLTAPAATAPTAALQAAAAGGRGRPGVPRPALLAVLAVLLVGAVTAGWLALAGDSPPQRADAGSTTDPTGGLHSSAPSPRSPGPTTGSVSPEPTVSGPVVPADAVGSDAKGLEERLKALGYHVVKADIESAAAKDSVVATLPGPGAALTAGQSVVLVTSKGTAAREPSDAIVPDGLIGAVVKDVEERLKQQGLEVKKVGVSSARAKDTVVATYPAPGETAAAGSVVLAVSDGH